MGIRQSILTRIRVAFLGAGLFAGLIIIRILDIQVVEGDHWQQVARENGLKYREVKATRGNVLSDNGGFLATSLPFYQMAIDPTLAEATLFEQNVDTLSSLMADFFEEKAKDTIAMELRQARLAGNRYYVASRKKYVSYQDRKEMEQWPLVREGRLKGGVIFEKVDMRFRPYGMLARRTVGFLINSDSTGEIKGRGLEYSFNTEMAGKDGEALYQRLAGGRWKPVDDESMVRTVNGLDIQTTLSIDIQQYATNILDKALQRHSANYGTLILMEVETGEIKAMVNLGRGEDGKYSENFNYAVQGVVEPGSTMKAASMMALFENTQLQLTDTVNTEAGQYAFYDDCVMSDAEKFGYGKIDVTTVFEKSSNIGVSKLVFKYFQNSPEVFCQYLDRFGLTRKIGFQMEGEGDPVVRRPGSEFWSGCSLPWMSIGYEMQLAPIHVLNFYNSIANNGKMIEPMLVKKVLKGGHITIKEFEPRILNPKICSDRTLGIMRQLLEGVVERGTAKYIKNDKYKIAGKTGTTHKVQKGQYVDKYYASFVGYFPADKPKYSCIVAIDEPRTGAHFGGDVAAPVFKELADWLYIRGVEQHLHEQPLVEASAPRLQAGHYQELTQLANLMGIKSIMANTVPWVRTSVQTDTLYLNDTWYAEGFVPDMRGMNLKDAIYLLENSGLQVRTIGVGRVQKQSLPPGRKARKGETIYLTLD